MENRKIAGLIVIATGKYDKFLPDLFFSADKHFLKDHDIDIYLFSDKEFQLADSLSMGMSLHRFPIPHLPFPFPTLYRYKWITQFADQLVAENLFYIDADMVFCGDVSEEVLCDGLLAVRHPGLHSSNGWGSPHTHPQSLAYVKPELRHDYYCGGFQGGTREAYLKCSSDLADMIDKDLETAKNINYTKNGGVLAEWWDETMWNWYCKTHAPAKVLDPSYCMVEQPELRKKWGIDHLPVKIIALAKDHSEIRS